MPVCTCCWTLAYIFVGQAKYKGNHVLVGLASLRTHNNYFQHKMGCVVSLNPKHC